MKAVFVAILKHDDILCDCHIFKKPVTEDQAMMWFFRNSSVTEEFGFENDFESFDDEFSINILESEI